MSVSQRSFSRKGDQIMGNVKQAEDVMEAIAGMRGLWIHLEFL